jgi:hypothetical protein
VSASWYAPAGEYCKDHTIIERDGLFHLFSISGTAGTSWYYTNSESKLSHSVSADLRRWEFRGHVLSARGELMAGAPGTRPWREDKVWAPHCIEADGRYHMFYTAVEHQHTARDEFDLTTGREIHVERICVATSTDLEQWTASPTPVFEETADTSAHPGRALRDPMVLRDEGRGIWVMYVTMLTAEGRNAVGALTSPDLADWSFERFVYIERQDAETTTESPFVTTWADSFFLFMNDGYAVSDDVLEPFGEVRGYSGRVPGWGAGENLLVDGMLRRSLIGGAPLIHENGKPYGGQVALFDVAITAEGVSILPFSR